MSIVDYKSPSLRRDLNLVVPIQTSSTGLAAQAPHRASRIPPAANFWASWSRSLLERDDLKELYAIL